MGQKDQSLLTEKLQAVREIGAERLGKAERESFLKALDQLYANVSLDEVLGAGSEQLYAASLALWKFCAVRKPGAPHVRFYNPGMTEHGWASPHSVLEVVNDDMPFLVDSLTAFLTERSIGIHALLHPVLTVTRDAKGALTGLTGPDAKGAMRESVIQVQVDQIADDKILKTLEAELLQVLADVRVAVTDWKPILGKLSDVVGALRKDAPKGIASVTAEVIEFLEWLAQDHFTFLGYREYRIGEGRELGSDTVDGSGLGLMRDPDYSVLRDASGNYAHWSPDMDAFVTDDSPLLILKANRRSTVHRTAHFDLIGVKHYDAKGRVIGEHLFVGHFTSAAYNRSPRAIPLLRQKVERIVARAGFAPNSHDAKALTNVLETYPRDELFQSADDQRFQDNVVGVLHLATRPRTRLFVRPDRFGRFVSCLVYVPRERYNTELRIKIGDILAETLNGRVATWTPSFSNEALARVHFVVALKPGGAPDYDIAAIEQQIVGAVRSWGDVLRDGLIEKLGEHEGNRLHALYHQGFAHGYRDANSTVTAIADIAKMEELTGDRPLALKFYRRLEDPDTSVRFKLYHLGPAVPLSDCLPVLENMGFRVLEEHPFKVTRAEQDIWVHDFFMQSADGSTFVLSELRDKLERTFTAVWSREADDDPLNRLVLLAGTSVRETMALRAYSRFLRQARIPYSIDYMEDALADNPAIARSLVALFHAMFDPAEGGDPASREAKAAGIADEIETALEAVASLDVDSILRRFRNAIQATLRTNYYQLGADGQPKGYVSFKFDSAALDELPQPRPWREIFVYSTWIEGVHLRGGPVARGGLRWSDRKEDYRTEVLGLVKAQQVKNAVIVPFGSKGGFLPKALPAGGSRDEVLAEAIRSYKTFLSGLLDITDNLDGQDVVPPEAVVRRDGDDPYLVVAADKGTATFSDIANGMAAEYGFWLGDAFASGGSNGYDHKGMGITAKGAWEAVKRHFRELGHDVQKQPFTVIGCGDMSGDVFGNGMLLSDQIKLVAAFDHRDIFIDPSPDPAKSFAERTRMFALPRSSWQDYDAKLISKGGGVFSRSSKSITLTPEIRELTGLKSDRVTPFQLIHALLKAPADLLWFGGIGTYIKASEETHSDAGDRANDATRVDADEVRARVVGEGANLGVTQRGRIELSGRGVKINTDAVDNSAGVDCSDHEVNIKIALGAVVGAGDMTDKQRNALLAKMTDEVAELVLQTNYNQTLAISLVEARAPALLEDHARFMRALEGRGLLDRVVELLPTDEELAERRKDGRGLTRPEIAVLVAYAKINVFSELLGSDLPDDPFMERLLTNYMPGPIRVKYKAALETHRLRREIIATVAANAFVNEAGPSLFHRLNEETGASVGQIVRAFIIAREVFGLPAIAAEVNALDNKAPALTQVQMHLALSDMVAAQSLRLLQGGDGPVQDAIKLYGPGVAEVAATAHEMIAEFSKTRLTQRTKELTKAEAPKALAEKIARLELLGGALDIVEVAATLGRDVADVAANYFAAGARFGLDWLRSVSRQIEPTDHWERIALGRLMAELRTQQSAIGAAALAVEGTKPGASSVTKWIEANAEAAARADRMMAELRASGALSVAKLAAASSQLRAVSKG
ncbi:NAD-glutamate dehydrogenase [Defluviimonas salinarum]|uniref:NAD-glutamate dehydrogenase n=1 Tax=Defluviimonas salinarum TaxID=2992147 RepID=A0ABT3IYW3_9RHOB|nr:NAD-glutamate dehydrogenase [Defluviimonas salinarum]MCW3780628.1 NAD-glutamate dehydrogenase [Defluviimonas salinarum]